jgi:hypothetical protein
MAILYPYSQRLAQKLANPPAPGENRHAWLFGIAAAFKAQGADLADVQRRLEAAARAAGWLDRLPEIARDIAKLACADVKPSEKLWMPERNERARTQALAVRPMFAPEPKSVTAAEVLSHLFSPGEWVCMAQDQAHATTQRLEDVLPVARHMAFVVANPMTAPFGLTQAGHTSPRCLHNATHPNRRRYVVVEFDTGDSTEAQASLLTALHTSSAPLALVVFSGGKSLHGWYNVSALRPSAKLLVFRRGVRLGADASLWDPCKLVRMPGGMRDAITPQAILYWEPEHAA